MQYLHVVWHHECASDPIAYYAEVGQDSWEIRRVQEYRDGRLEWADKHHETDAIGLSEVAIDVDEIQRQPEFEVRVLGRDAFADIWAKARGEG